MLIFLNQFKNQPLPENKTENIVGFRCRFRYFTVTDPEYQKYRKKLGIAAKPNQIFWKIFGIAPKTNVKYRKLRYFSLFIKIFIKVKDKIKIFYWFKPKKINLNVTMKEKNICIDQPIDLEWNIQTLWKVTLAGLFDNQWKNFFTMYFNNFILK